MWRIRRPSKAEIERFLADQADRPFSYREVGASRRAPPAGYTIDHTRTRLGGGEAAFERAVGCLRAWKSFELEWLELHRRAPAVEAGATVALLVRCFGLWSLNACRVIYVLDENATVRRYGFAYGTLPEHAERGEERFSVEWSPGGDGVWYEVLAFSRPNRLLTKLAYPLARRLQRRFVRDSIAAMRRAVSEGKAGPLS